MGGFSSPGETFSWTRVPIGEAKTTLHKPSTETDRIFTPSEIINAAFSGLHNIPFEAVDLTLSFLSPISLAALRKTCRTFYYDYEATSQVKLDQDQWFSLLCMLEGDANGMFVCTVCKTLHEAADFFPMELQNGPCVRRCKKTSPLLRVCPYFNLSFEDVREMKMARSTTEPRMVCTFDTCWVTASFEPANPEHPHESKFIMKTLTLISVYPEGYLPPSEDINRILGECDIFLCPHNQLDHPDISALYECWAKQGTDQHPHEYCIQCKSRACGICDSRFRFISWPVSNTGIRYIYLETTRSLLDRDDVNDPSWLSHLSVVKDPGMRQLWSLRITDRQSGFIEDLRRFTPSPDETPSYNIATETAYRRYNFLQAEVRSREYDHLRMSDLSRPLWRKPGADWPDQW